jgi:hypothetical protein
MTTPLICSCRRHASQHGWPNVLELARDRVESFFNEDDEVFVRTIGGEIARGGNFPGRRGDVHSDATSKAEQY